MRHADGTIRSLAGIVDDLAGAALASSAIQQLSEQGFDQRPIIDQPVRLGPCVAGYCIVNDLSERECQLERCGQWIKGKSCDTFAPIGPYLVTRDEVPDPQQLGMWLEVDGYRYY